LTSPASKPPRTPSSNRKPRATRSSTRKTRAGEVSDDERSRKSDSAAGSVTSAGTRTTATRERLPRWLEKLLAQLFEGPLCKGIENIGRGKDCKLESLLDTFQANRTEEPLKPFGERGDEIRRKITQKHQGWKDLPREKYLVKLARLKVRPAAAATDWSHRSTSQKSSDEDESSASLSTKSEDENLVTPKSTARKRSSKKANVPAIITTTSPDEAPAALANFHKSPTPRAHTTSTISSISPDIEALAKSLGKFP